MHELALAKEVLAKIQEEAQAKGITKVSLAKIKIGESRVHDLPELKEIFIDISKGTVAEGMRLEVEISPLKAFCAVCKKEFASSTPRLDCPHCGSTDIQISSGKELLVKRILSG